MPVNLKKKCFEAMKRYAVFLFGSYEKENLLSDSRKSKQGNKTQNFQAHFKLFPGEGFALSKYSPVTLHYSPATAILNETPYCTERLPLVSMGLCEIAVLGQFCQSHYLD